MNGYNINNLYLNRLIIYIHQIIYIVCLVCLFVLFFLRFCYLLVFAFYCQATFDTNNQLTCFIWDFSCYVLNYKPPTKQCFFFGFFLAVMSLLKIFSWFLFWLIDWLFYLIVGWSTFFTSHFIFNLTDSIASENIKIGKKCYSLYLSSMLCTVYCLLKLSTLTYQYYLINRFKKFLIDSVFP